MTRNALLLGPLLIMAMAESSEAERRTETDPPVTKRTVTVTGRVHIEGDDGAGVPGVQVSDGEQLVSTGADGGYRLTVDVDEFRFVFIVRPNGTRPVDRWYFLIPYDEATTEYDVDFALAEEPASQAERDFAFIHISDSQFASEKDGRWLGEDFEELSQQSGEPAFAIMSGDLVQTGYIEEWDRYAAARKKMRLPMYEVFGGHGGNYSEPDHSVGHYRLYCGPDWYAFHYGGVCFVITDGQHGYMTEVSRKRQETWLERFCAALPEGTPIVASAHYPMPIKPFFDRHRPIAFLYGHWHDNTLNYYRDVPYLCTGPIRSHDSGALTRTYRLCRIRDGHLSTETRPTAQVRRLDVTVPQAGAAVPRAAGQLTVRVTALHSPSYVQRVEALVSGPGSVPQSLALEQLGQWTWGLDWPLASQVAGDYVMRVTAVDDRATSWQTERRFSLVDDPAPTPRTGADWPTYIGRTDAPRYREAPLEPPLTLAWTVPTGGRIQQTVSPVLAAGRLFVGGAVCDPGATQSVLACYEPTTGALQWRTDLRTPVRFSPAATADHVFAQTSAGRVLCLDAASGTPVWEDQLLPDDDQWQHHTAMGPILIHEDKVIAYLSNGPGRVYDAATGAVVSQLPAWPRQLYFASPYPHNGKLYQSLTYFARCIDLATGDLAWEQKLSVRGIGAGVVVGDTFYISGNGRILRVGLDGTVDTSWKVSGGPTLRVGGVAVAGDTLFAAGGELSAVDLKTGQRRWRFDPSLAAPREQASRRQILGSLSTPAVAGTTLYVGGEDGYLYALDAATGDVIWRWDTGVPVKGSPIVSGNMLFVCDYDGNLWAFVGADE